jgi:stalled ribosome rescue protein Dom34
MTHYHACVWIDHRQARIFAVGLEGSDVTVVKDHAQPHHIHRKADHVGLGTEPLDHAFLEDVARALSPYKAILICGPGRARTELAGYLNEEYPLVSKRVWGIEAMDHPTDPQMIEMARKYFRAADPMHA